MTGALLTYTALPVRARHRPLAVGGAAPHAAVLAGERFHPVHMFLFCSFRRAIGIGMSASPYDFPQPQNQRAECRSALIPDWTRFSAARHGLVSAEALVRGCLFGRTYPSAEPVNLLDECFFRRDFRMYEPVSPRPSGTIRRSASFLVQR